MPSFALTRGSFSSIFKKQEDNALQQIQSPHFLQFCLSTLALTLTSHSSPLNSFHRCIAFSVSLCLCV